MALTQIQIIQSLGEALTWFEKELEWGVKPQELNHLTGRVGELYAAMITRGQMALENNQKGYDVISGDNEFVSVKTVTTSNHVRFNANTMDLVDRVIILKINFDPEIEIEELLDATKEDFLKNHARISGQYYNFLTTLTSRSIKRPSHELPTIEDAVWNGEYQIVRHENASISLLHLESGTQMAMVKPILRDIAIAIGVDLNNDKGNPKNTRQLGHHILQKLNFQASDKKN